MINQKNKLDNWAKISNNRGLRIEKGKIKAWKTEENY
jgi:hypothetical protein